MNPYCDKAADELALAVFDLIERHVINTRTRVSDALEQWAALRFSVMDGTEIKKLRQFAEAKPGYAEEKPMNEFQQRMTETNKCEPRVSARMPCHHGEEPCGCHIVEVPNQDVYGENRAIAYCPLHKAAPRTLEALDKLLGAAAGWWALPRELHDESAAAIAEAKPKTKGA